MLSRFVTPLTPVLSRRYNISLYRHFTLLKGTAKYHSLCFPNRDKILKLVGYAIIPHRYTLFRGIPHYSATVLFGGGLNSIAIVYALVLWICTVHYACKVTKSHYNAVVNYDAVTKKRVSSFRNITRVIQKSTSAKGNPQKLPWRMCLYVLCRYWAAFISVPICCIYIGR